MTLVINSSQRAWIRMPSKQSATVMRQARPRLGEQRQTKALHTSRVEALFVLAGDLQVQHAERALRPLRQRLSRLPRQHRYNKA